METTGFYTVLVELMHHVFRSLQKELKLHLSTELKHSVILYLRNFKWFRQAQPPLGGYMIWLIGCKGMLGSEVARQLDEKKAHWVGTDKEIDITDPQALAAFEKSVETSSYLDTTCTDKHIKWIINCSAYTNVDKAEEDTELADRLNNQGALNIARTARSIGAKLIHISTDYVFDGSGKAPYTEDMEKNPLGVYGRTKAAGEEAIQKEMTQYYILRTAWLYGYDGKNLFTP